MFFPRLIGLVAAFPILAAAVDLTGYEYVVVGSGAGGGPLAARLALAGHKTLLIEAGDDQGANANYTVPAFSARSSEDANLSWNFFVKHYADEERQARDFKTTYETPDGGEYTGLNPPEGSTMKGTLYPRTGTLGGCTAHNALIAVYPHRSDFDNVATITGDDSWSADNMRKYFTKLEKNQYLLPGQKGHGYDGWLGTDYAPIDIVTSDPQLLSLVGGAAFALSNATNAIVNLGTLVAGDANADTESRDKQPALYQIPLSTSDGKRGGSREFVLAVRDAKADDGSKKYPLDVRMNCHVTKVTFDQDVTPPRATGVEFLDGQYLYKASPKSNGAKGEAGSAPNSKMRKRTKTGCLTCRKRRIKCGEERPTCANCIKSKRQCEGYNQRVIFKPPIGDWPNHPGVVSTIQYHTSMLPGTRNQSYRGPEPAAAMQENMLGSIQPRMHGSYDFSHIDPSSGPGPSDPQQGFTEGNPNYPHEQAYQQPLPSPLHQQPLQSPNHQVHNHTPTASYFPPPPTMHTSPQTQFRHDSHSTYQAPLQYTQSASYPPVSVPYNHESNLKAAVPQPPPIYPQAYRSDSQQAEGTYRDHSSVSPRSDQHPHYTEAPPGVQRYESHPQAPVHSIQGPPANFSQIGNLNYPAVSHADFSHASYPSVQMPIHDMTPDVKYMSQPVLEQPYAVSQAQQPQPQLLLDGFGGDDHVSPTQVLDEAAIENEDDDYWDVQSDEDMFDAETAEDEKALLATKEFDTIRRIHFENYNELGIRRYDAFLYDGLLSDYRPEYAASPLRNPKTARVFAHYIHVTGPTLSMYERNPRNPTLIFEGSTRPAQQGLWTYTLPMKALNHQGLLHAMLALASLHIARLQGASITPSYKHYAYSLKRLVRSLSNPKKRLSTLTLATSLLLAFYEVWTAEHVKWGTHLIGAQRLITELDFRSLTREARRLRAAQTAMERSFPYQNPEMLIDQRQFDQRLKDSALMPDQSLVSTIVGNNVNYDDFGMVFEDNGARHDTRPKIPAKLDLQSYETLQDIYWSYARHDAYQSIVSGNRLINPYRKWSDCPPRAPLGRTDALYGSHDHIILLLGRIADFTVRDRSRKLRQIEADGGWRPRPGMPGFGNMGPPPGGSHGQQQMPTSSTGPPPQMQGPPPGWKGPPPPGWTGQAPSQPPPGFGPPSMSAANPPQGGPPRPPAMPSFYGMAPSAGPGPILSSYENPNYERSPQTPNAPHPQHSDLPAEYEKATLEWESITNAHTAVVRVLEQTDAFAPLPEDTYPPAPGEYPSQQGNMTPFGPAILHRSYDISILWTIIHLSKIILLRSHPGMPPAAQMAAGVCASATAPYCMLIGRICAGFQMPIDSDLSPFLGAVLTESTLSLFFAGITFQDPRQREWLITRLLETDKRTGWASAGIIAKGCETAWEKAAEMGRGPPYKRRTKRVQAVSVDMEEEETGGRNREQGRVQEIHGETRYVVKKRPPPWAMNLLGTEEDLRAGMERFGL